MKFEVPKRYIKRLKVSTHMIRQVLWWERQKRCSGRKRKGAQDKKKYCNDNSLVKILGEEKMKTREWSSLNFYFFQNYMF